MTSPVEAVTDRRESAQPARSRLPHYFMSALLARTADEGARVALVLLALDRTGSAATGGILVAVLLIPHVVAAPLIGSLVDRAHRPTLVLAAAIAIFAAGLAAAIAVLGRGPLWLTLILLAVAGSCGPAITGGLTSRLAGLAGPEREARAFGWDSLFYNVASMAGPALVALLAATVGVGWAGAVLAASAGLGAVGVATLRLPPTAALPGKTPRPRLLDGLRAIVKSSALRGLTLTTSLGQIGPGALAVVAATLAAAARRPATGGLLLTAVAAGALVGSLLWTWRPLAARRAPQVTAWAMVGVGVPLAVAAAVDSLPLTAALFGLSGFFVGPFAAALFLARNAYAPAVVRAQIFTIGAGLKVTAAALGAGLVGLAAPLAPSIQLLLVAASPILAGGLGLLLTRRYERPGDEPPTQA